MSFGKASSAKPFQQSHLLPQKFISKPYLPSVTFKTVKVKRQFAFNHFSVFTSLFAALAACHSRAGNGPTTVSFQTDFLSHALNTPSNIHEQRITI